MKNFSNLDIALGLSTLLFLILYIWEKSKPKTEAQILRIKEKEKKKEDQEKLEKEKHLSVIENLKTKDEEFKNLKKPVLYIGCDFQHLMGCDNIISCVLSVTDGDYKSHTFKMDGLHDDLHAFAPFFMSIWCSSIQDGRWETLKVKDILF